MQLWALCQALQKQGAAVALVCPPTAELLRHAEGSGVTLSLTTMRQDYDMAAVAHLRRFFRQWKPDIVHAHHPRAHALSLLALTGLKGPKLVVSRRVSFPLPRWNPFSQLKYRHPHIARFVAVSDDIRRVLEEGGVRPERIAVIRSGVDVERFSPRPPDTTLQQSLRIPLDLPLVGHLTHFSWWKGQAVFLQAVAQLVRRGVRGHFLLAGKDTDGPEARALVQELGISSQVTLAGFRRDMPEVLSLLTLSVVASLQGEGFSGVIRESMAMGIGVVATDVGGNRELVEEGVTGCLVPPGNPEALAEGILRQLSHRERREAMARTAQARVREKYSIQAMVQQTLDLYKSLSGFSLAPMRFR